MDILFDHLKRLRQSIFDDVKNVLKYHEETDVGGYHGIPRQVFCYVDHLGKIVYGKGGTEEAIHFINDYFPEKYKDKSELIYEMWRHGTVHSYEPKTIEKDDKVLTWLSNISSNKIERNSHLWVLKRPEQKGHNIFYLKINVNQLVDDLIVSLDRLANELKKSSDKAGIVRENIRVHMKNTKLNKCRSKAKVQFNNATKKADAIMDKNRRVIDK